MMAKEYSDEESKNRTLQMQVCWEVEKVRGLDPPRPPEAVAAAATALAGNVGFLNVKKMVELTDRCVSAQHVANMSADMSATQPKMVSAKVLTMLSRHAANRYVGNMSAL